MHNVLTAADGFGLSILGAHQEKVAGYACLGARHAPLLRCDGAYRRIHEAPCGAESISHEGR